ncbi:para-nitrobenzyl esterase [Colletotrichum truncatum]|uniref:Para-nitrobenzyl esterase n=1 Tax=Colletotrichum truncatum TaxID=5467 RepID=A0ACC3YY33_COLTU|nr:para-nitrobenzyl esterase [Colletotrichum truncatum]KAF6790867.1 para-nitrobenzyl esterase [Colletotrichum truncatum]
MAEPLQPPPVDRDVIVRLPTQTTPSYVQTVIGKKSYLSEDVDEFRGIPYGEVSQRWTHSRLRTHLPQDEYDAAKDGPVSPFAGRGNSTSYFQAYLPIPEFEKSEFDCLNLIIVRPSIAALSRIGIQGPAKLPVLVWIHGGGGSESGSHPLYDPVRLVSRSLEIGSPIIAVLPNFRHGVFGFLGSTDILTTQTDDENKGLNFGLYDQKVALAWVARNIAHFGGDPKQVTFGGSSSGSFAVHVHLLDSDSHATEPLFKRTILQSGAQFTLSPLPLEDMKAPWDELCQYWGIQTENSQQKVEFLRKVSTEAMIEFTTKSKKMKLGPIADDLTMTMQTATFPDVDQGQDVKSVGYDPVEVMLGASDVEEAGFVQNDVDLKRLQTIFAESYGTPARGDEILNAYGLVKGSEQSVLRANYERFLSDAKFDLPIYMLQTTLSKQRRADLGDATSIQPYSIQFGNPFPGPKKGAAHHCVELIYLFDPFHNALVDADNGIFMAYPESSDELSARQETDATDSTVDDQSERRTVSNLELVGRVQDHYIGFITGKSTQKAAEGEMLVWGRDRTLRVENLEEDPMWVKRIGRLKLLQEDIPAIRRVLNAL